MKVLVAVKRVVDPYATIRVDASRTAVDTQHLKHTINPFDEVALEEAVRLLDTQVASEVVAVSIGNVFCQETLRHALAFGASRALHIQTDATLSCLAIAKILQKIVQQEQIDLVLMGKQAIDDDSAQTPSMLAALLNWPQALAALAIQYELPAVFVTQAMEISRDTVQVQLPAVISVDLSLNQPRYMTLPHIVRGQKKPLIGIALAQLALELTTDAQVLNVRLPTRRTLGVRVHSVEELVDKLRCEAMVRPV